MSNPVQEPKKERPANRLLPPAIRREYCYTISDAKGEYIAHAKVLRVDGVLWLTDVWTHAEHRQKGYASDLMRVVFDDWYGHTIYLSVQPYTDEPMNSAALARFYGRYGFQPTDVPGVLKYECPKMPKDLV